MIDVIVGTQLVTKGYHFPDLTLVGVIDADLGLEGGDLRAGERTYQQIAQVAGRAGRGEKPGEVLIQTRHPMRPSSPLWPQATATPSMPPRPKDAAMQARRPSVAGPRSSSQRGRSEAKEAARAIGGTRPNLPDVAMLGPAPAPLSLLRGRYRYRLLVNAKRSAGCKRCCANGWGR
jgi:primosomal protein N' (replication factor Y)